MVEEAVGLLWDCECFENFTVLHCSDRETWGPGGPCWSLFFLEEELLSTQLVCVCRTFTSPSMCLFVSLSVSYSLSAVPLNACVQDSRWF